MLQAPVGGNHKIFGFNRFCREIEPGGAKNHASVHKVTSFCHSTTFAPKGKPPESELFLNFPG
jgi:hypothetical protein